MSETTEHEALLWCPFCGGEAATESGEGGISGQQFVEPAARWRDIETAPLHKTVLLYRVPDLAPVVGYRMERGEWGLEENGPEDGEHRKYPLLSYAPTHWMPLPAPPIEPEAGTGAGPEHADARSAQGVIARTSEGKASPARGPAEPAAREPDGWVTEWRYAGHPDSWREPVLHATREDAERHMTAGAGAVRRAAYPMRVRPVYFDAPGAAPEPDAELLDALAELLGPDGYLPDPCRYDHHGFCQEHGLGDRPCVIERIRTLYVRLAPAASERTQEGTDAG